MRFVRLSMTGFTGVAETAHVDLDANVVVLLAQNGYGKSTICDAMAWALTGQHPRGADPRSKYGSGETQVAVVLRDADSIEWSIRRIVANPAETNFHKLLTSVVLEGADSRLRGDEATSWLARQLLPLIDGAHGESGTQALVDGYYLQQESLRGFLTSRSDDERFAALSQMVGARRLSELVRTLDSAKNSWSRAITNSEQELVPLELALRTSEDVHSALTTELETAAGLLEDEAAAWARQARHLVSHETDDQGSSTIDGETLLEQLQRQLRRNEETRTILLSSIEELQTLNVVRKVEPVPPSESELHDARQNLAVAERQLATASVLVGSIERSIQSARSERKELASMAALALRHVGATCPTCGQGVNDQALKTRLEGIVARATDRVEADEFTNALALQTEAHARVQEARATRQSASEAESEYQLWLSNEKERTQRLADVEERLAATLHRRDLPRTFRDRVELVQSAVTSINSASVDLRDQIDEYEGLRGGLRLPSLRVSLEAARHEVDIARRDYEAARQDIDFRRFTHQRADLLVRALKEDSENFLNQRLRDIQPILEQLYSAIDPHPTFRDVKLETRNTRGKNRLTATLTDTVRKVSVNDPGTLLSTSQANAVAVALFLAFNLGLRPTTLESVVLDDPLQNLDDVHLLGLVDLLRRLLPHRQVIVTRMTRPSPRYLPASCALFGRTTGYTCCVS